MKEAQRDVIKEMVERWPEDKTLWDIWTSVLAMNGQEKEAFAVFKMMYQTGLIETEADILKLVQYHSFYDMPFQAAEILEAEIRAGRVSETSKNLKMLGQLFNMANVRDRPKVIFEKADRLSED